MQGNTYTVTFSKVKDEMKELQVHSVNATLLLKEGVKMQFVSKHPFNVKFTGKSPFTPPIKSIDGILVKGQYQSDILIVDSVRKLTAYPYDVTVDGVKSDPQVIVDPDQPIIFGLLAAAGAGAVAGAITALIISKKR